MMASVMGKVMVTFVPIPTSLEMSTMPPSLPMFVFTTSIPTPRPDRLFTCSRVVKPGRKTSPSTSRTVSSAASFRREQPLADGAGDEHVGIHPRAVVLDLDEDVVCPSGRR